MRIVSPNRFHRKRVSDQEVINRRPQNMYPYFHMYLESQRVPTGYTSSIVSKVGTPDVRSVKSKISQRQLQSRRGPASQNPRKVEGNKETIDFNTYIKRTKVQAG